MPATGGPFPVVLVVQEIFGVHEHIKDVCRRFARGRLLRRGTRAVTRARATSRSSTTTARSSRRWSRRCRTPRSCRTSTPPCLGCEVEPGRRCARGRDGLLLGRAHHLALCRAQPEAQGGCRLVRPSRGRGHRAAAEVPDRCAASLKAPVLGLYGGQDQGIPLADVEKIAPRSRRRSSRPRSSCSRRAARLPRRLPAELPRTGSQDAWRQCLAWFRSTGSAGRRLLSLA